MATKNYTLTAKDPKQQGLMDLQSEVYSLGVYSFWCNEIRARNRSHSSGVYSLGVYSEGVYSLGVYGFWCHEIRARNRSLSSLETIYRTLNSTSCLGKYNSDNISYTIWCIVGDVHQCHALRDLLFS